MASYGAGQPGTDARRFPASAVLGRKKILHFKERIKSEVKRCAMARLCSTLRMSHLTILAAAVLATFPAPYAAAASSGAAPAFAGVSLSVASPTVPPGGLLQMQVFVTEPNPILKGRQRMGMAPRPLAALGSEGVAPATAPLGAIRDAALFSPAGDVSGVAVGKSGSTQIFFSSPLTSFGTTIDTPVMAIAMPVTTGATVGQTVNLNLDPSVSLWYDPNQNSIRWNLSPES